MGRPCTGCEHPKRKALDAALVEGTLSNGTLAGRYGMSKDAVRRHRAHVSASLTRVVEDRETAGAVSALDRLEDLYARASRVLADVEAEGRTSQALAAIRECRGLVETLAKITGELDDRPTVQVLNVATSPEWLRVRTALTDALGPYPEAAQAVAGRLLALEAPQ